MQGLLCNVLISVGLWCHPLSLFAYPEFVLIAVAHDFWDVINEMFARWGRSGTGGGRNCLNSEVPGISALDM